MSLKIGMLMDPIADINIKKDTSFALLLAAQAKGHELYYIEPQQLWLNNGTVFAVYHPIRECAGTAWSAGRRIRTRDLTVATIRGNLTSAGPSNSSLPIHPSHPQSPRS